LKRFIIPLLCCLLNASLAQKNYQGIVVDSVTMQGIPLVHVMNKRNQSTVSTNENGIFKIKAFATDTLIFSMLGYQTIELPLLYEEDVLFIRLRESFQLLQELTIRATRLYPGNIENRTREAPRKPMAPYQAAQSPFTYFSKTEREKRKIYRYIEESNKTQTFVQVITNPEVKKILMDAYELTEDEYYDGLAKFNFMYQDMQYATNPDDIMEALHGFFQMGR
jgi:hypothetical protein